MSFHDTKTSDALRESIRMLRPRGFSTMAYVLADLETDPFQLEIENRIRDMAPAVRRSNTPVIGHTRTYEALLNQYPGFRNCICLATTEGISMSGISSIGLGDMISPVRSPPRFGILYYKRSRRRSEGGSRPACDFGLPHGMLNACRVTAICLKMVERAWTQRSALAWMGRDEGHRRTT